MDFKKTTWLTILVFGFLLFYSFLYANERIINTDGAFHTFTLINSPSFAIQNYRFGALLTQWVPILCSKLNVELDTIIRLYSLSFFLFPSLITAFILLKLKDWKMSLVLLCFYLLIFIESFFWPISELQQGIPFLILLLSLSRRKISDTKFYVLIFINVPIVLYFHPLLIFPLLFLILYFSSLDEKLKNLRTKIFVGYTIIFFFLKTFVFPVAKDDLGKLVGLKDIFHSLVHFYELESLKNFFFHLPLYYFSIPLILISYLILNNKTDLKRTLLVILFPIGYLGLILFSYPNGAEVFYIENMYLPLGLMLGSPFIFEILPKFKHKNYGLLLIIGLILINIIRIPLVGKKYTDRLRYTNSLLSEMSNKSVDRIILNEKETQMNILRMSWSMCYESILLSSLKQNHPRSIFICTDKNEFKTEGTKDWFITPWGALRVSELNQKYFKLKYRDYQNNIELDTAQGYKSKYTKSW